ncbi:M50 family metallopeptidase [Brevibacillus sp. B_LB10_24]|uniref:M50 family metallopeptidase n=1 Tax=Brevibacillus sp. B_LB10_24 TaxID=3380645 RepID=UPI0038BD78FA
MTEWRCFGVVIRIHLLFWAVIGVSLAAGYFLETLTLFVIVIIHELGHIAAARELGWRVAQIQLLPFGGVATMEEDLAADPLEEIVIALAGPFMNVAMIFCSLLFWWLGIWSEAWTVFFINSNLMIAGFNLLPIWPLDGGRILQALLCYRLPYRKAGLLSIGASVLFAAALFGLGLLYWHLNLMAVAVYLTVVNAQAFVRFPYQFLRFLMGKHAINPELSHLRSVSLAPTVTAMEASHLLRRGYYHLFFIEGGNGALLWEEQLLNALLFEQKHHVPLSKLI